jgi:hypothetical protein
MLRSVPLIVASVVEMASKGHVGTLSTRMGKVDGYRRCTRLPMLLLQGINSSCEISHTMSR